MNFFRNIFKEKVQKEEQQNIIKVYLDEEIRQYETLPLTPDTTAESIIVSLSQFPTLKKQISALNIKYYHIILIIRNLKNNIPVLRRRINPFENIQDIISLQSSGHEYFWILQKQIEANEYSSRDSIMGDNFNESVFHEYRKTAEPEKFQRNGRLLKKRKNGEYKEKEFSLFKDNLVYFKPGEDNKKLNVIPLVGARADKDVTSRDKHAFEIKSADQTIRLKAKSEVDMQGWIHAFNAQAVIANLNANMNHFDKEIKAQEYKYEKIRNEEITTIINNPDKFMEKKSYRHLLLDFLARENVYYRDIKFLVDSLYVIRPDLEQATWLELITKFVEDLDEILKNVMQKDQGQEERKDDEQAQLEGDLYSALYKHISKDDKLNKLRQTLNDLKGEFKDEGREEIREEITKIIKSVSDFLLDDLRENYKRLIQSETLFQAKLTDLIKKTIFHCT